jgi:hypothetical protein
MAMDFEHAYASKRSNGSPTYSSNILPKLQSLLANLADLNLAHEREIEAVRTSCLDDKSKLETIERLLKIFQERKAPIVEELLSLESTIRSTCGQATGNHSQ